MFQVPPAAFFAEPVYAYGGVAVQAEDLYLWSIALGLGLLALILGLFWGSPCFAVEQADPDSIGNYIYRDEGIEVTGPESLVDFDIGARINYDLGYIDDDAELQAAFPDFEGAHDNLRRLSVSFLGQAFDIIEIKFEIDFAHTEDIKDDWIRITLDPVLPHITIGHIKEPFSLDMLSSGNYTTFMEVSLPTRALTPFRNIGFTANGTWLEERMTWAGGSFLNTGSFANEGDAQDQIDNANGFDLVGRVTGLPMYGDSGRRLLHLGLSYLQRYRNDDENDPRTQFRTRPEARLTDDRLVDTSRIYDQGQHLISLEAAWLDGPWSIQGEYFHDFVDSTSSLQFNGWYVQGSWVLTGESRKYQKSGGIFSQISPEHEFSFGTSGWGALELALRLSRVDLNDKYVNGGEEQNITVGLNWYLKPKIRFMVNYINIKVEDRADPVVDNGRADIIISRFQVNF